MYRTIYYTNRTIQYESLEDSFFHQYRVHIPQIVASKGSDVTHDGTSHDGDSCCSESHNGASCRGTSQCNPFQLQA